MTGKHETRSLGEELADIDAVDPWAPPLWQTGSVAHAFADCPDNKGTAEVCTTRVDPAVRRSDGVTACRYCTERATRDEQAVTSP